MTTPTVPSEHLPLQKKPQKTYDDSFAIFYIIKQPEHCTHTSKAMKEHKGA